MLNALAAGLPMLRALLLDDSVTHVTTITRRPLPSWIVLPGGQNVAEDSGASPTHPKLTNVVQSNFTSYPKDLLLEHDACIWALGSTTRGKAAAEYTEFTYGYIKSFLENLKASGRVTPVAEGGTGSVEKPFRFFYLSGEGADSSEKSRMLFARVKVRRTLGWHSLFSFSLFFIIISKTEIKYLRNVVMIGSSRERSTQVR